MNELVEVPIAFREAQDPDKIRDQSLAKVKAARDANLITDDQKTAMDDQIENAFAFDPLWTTSYQQIVANVGKGNAILIANCSMDFFHLSCTKTKGQFLYWMQLRSNKTAPK